MSDSLWKSLVKETKNEYAQAVSEGVIGGDVSEYIDSGSYSLNALISGDLFKGYPVGKVTGLAAEQAAGKCMRGSEIINVYFETHDDLEKFLSL